VNPTETAAYLRHEIEPLPDEFSGPRHRAAVRLKDGTYLPCVVFQDKERQVDLALRRFEQTRHNPDNHRWVVSSFVTGASQLSEWEVDIVEHSPYAWDIPTLKQIGGETAMSWTAFVTEMRDGRMMPYGTSFSVEFFYLPVGYGFRDIARIHNGMLYSETFGLTPWTPDLHKQVEVYREKPYFTCYLAGLEQSGT
jgi:hypothetical protein